MSMPRLTAVLFLASIPHAGVAAAESGTAGGGRPLVICLASVPDGFDPARGPAGSASPLITRQVFDTLVTVAEDGTTFEPSLAVSWQVSGDGREYRFRVRPDVEFHATDVVAPTRPFDARDVVFTFARMIDPGHPTSPPGEGGHSVGALDIASVLAEVEAVGTDTVLFRLKAPHSGFPAMLASEFGGVHSAEFGAAARGAGQAWMLDTHPVGTGPFRLEPGGASRPAPGPRRKPATRVVEGPDGKAVEVLAAIPRLKEQRARESLGRLRLTPHPGHWSGPVPGEGLLVEAESDTAERYRRLMAGECDLMPSPAAADIGTIAAGPDTSLLESPGRETLYVAFNTSGGPGANLWIRRALAGSVDRDAVAEALGAPADPAAGLFAAGPDLLPPVLNEHDVEAARAHLATAAEPAPDLRLLVPIVSPDMPTPLADAVAAAWTEIGAQVTLHKKLWPDFLAALDDGAYDAALLAWRAYSPDPLLNLEQVLACDAVGAGNASAWCDAEFDELLGMARAKTDPVARRRLVFAAGERIADQLPIMPLLHLRQRWAVRDVVQGLNGEALAAHDFRQAEPALRFASPPEPSANPPAPARTGAIGPGGPGSPAEAAAGRNRP